MVLVPERVTKFAATKVVAGKKPRVQRMSGAARSNGSEYEIYMKGLQAGKEAVSKPIGG